MIVTGVLAAWTAGLTAVVIWQYRRHKRLAATVTALSRKTSRRRHVTAPQPTVTTMQAQPQPPQPFAITVTPPTNPITSPVEQSRGRHSR